MKKIVLFTLLIFSISAFAQDIDGGPINSRTKTGVIDGVYLKHNIPTKRLVPYPPEREADIIWSRKIWRAIDLRQKINQPLYYPLDKITNPDPITGETNWVKNENRWSLWTIIRYHIMNGDLTLYSDYNPANTYIRDGDEFKYPIQPAPGKNYYTDSAFRKVATFYLADLGQMALNPLPNQYGEDSLDLNGQPVYRARDTIWVTSKDIVQYRLKEQWFFDKQRSVLDVRIIGLAPVRYKKDPTSGNITGTEEMFWLYYPTDCRYVFNNYYVYNSKNDSRWMSFDDYFQKRRFNSFIYKESNVYDRDIDKYRVGVQALHQSQKITEKIRNLEHDMWSY